LNLFKSLWIQQNFIKLYRIPKLVLFHITPIALNSEVSYTMIDIIYWFASVYQILNSKIIHFKIFIKFHKIFIFYSLCHSTIFLRLIKSDEIHCLFVTYEWRVRPLYRSQKRIDKNKSDERKKFRVRFDRVMSNVYENNIFFTVPCAVVEIHDINSWKSLPRSVLPLFSLILLKIFLLMKFMKQTSFTLKIIFILFLFDTQSNLFKWNFFNRIMSPYTSYHKNVDLHLI
jgi:hypothetical protein